MERGKSKHHLPYSTRISFARFDLRRLTRQRLGLRGLPPLSHPQVKYRLPRPQERFAIAA